MYIYTHVFWQIMHMDDYILFIFQCGETNVMALPLQKITLGVGEIQ